MRCPRCQQGNPVHARFCLGCGARLVLACSACGAELPAGARFCLQCGQAAAAGAPAAGPQAYTPKHLADRILTSKSALEGERKQVTVLFVDVVDSSWLAERLDPEDMHEVMDRVLRLMASTIHRYEGTVNQFLGDGLMALFGAPLALEDHAFRAVEAAISIQETIAGYSAELKRQRALELTLRLGLNTGLVVVGKIGDDLRMDYTAVGDTTHLAARLQALAEPGTILMTDATRRHAEGFVLYEPLGQRPVKGRTQPVPMFRVSGRRPRRTRLEVQADLGLTTLSGRQRELRSLHDCLDRAKHGNGEAVGIRGEPGVGKSRLVYEFRRTLENEAITWLEGRCVGYGASTPYLPILDMLRTHFQIDDGDNVLQIDQKLRHRAEHIALEPDGALPFLRELFGLPGDDEALKQFDAKERRRKIFETVRALIAAEAGRRPVILVLEDLQWIDQTSAELLAFLVGSLPSIRALLITTYRPDYVLPWSDTASWTQIALDLLTDTEVQTMVAGILDSRVVPPSLFRVVQQKAEGNPLFIEEMTASLRERGLIECRDGEVVWTDDHRVEIPTTVQDIIRARLDRLGDPVKRTAQTAAVIGREFSLTVLSRVAEEPHDVPRDLGLLTRVELVHESRSFPELEYIFKHAVIQDVAYQTLLVARRKELHAAIARAVEDIYADRLDEHAATLAYHYAHTDHVAEATQYAIAAGDGAARLSANSEARTYYEQALSLARSLSPSPHVSRRQIDVVLRLAQVAMTRHHFERDLKELSDAREQAAKLEDEARLGQVLYWLGRTHYVMGDRQTALAHAAESLSIADARGDEALAAPPVNLIGRIHLSSDFRKASEMMARSADQMRQLGNKIEESTAAGFAGHVYGYMGQFARALEYADRGVRVAREIRNPFAEAAGLLYRGVVQVQRGEWSFAIADLDNAEELAERAGDRFRVYIIKFWSGRAHTWAGNARRGKTILEQSLAIAETLGTTLFLTMPKAFLAETLVALGEVEDVPRLCQEAIELAEKVGDQQGGSLARRGLAMALLHLKPLDRPRSESAMVEAIRQQENMGARPELARSYASYAKLLTAFGELARADACRATAMSMFRELEMAWDLARLEGVLQSP
jgi:class 3 adenylate cyclase/tetratricopeptide (TPR) repeat protein